jgi:hypothetical protein
MDARVKPGHDECVHTNLNFKQQRYSQPQLRDLAAHARVLL